MVTSTTSTPALDELRPREQAALLPELLATYPEMADPLDELAARAGRKPGTYVHETDAAYELVTEAIAPYEEDLWRAAALDLSDVARTILPGIVDGLGRCGNARDGSVLAYAVEVGVAQLRRELKDWLDRAQSGDEVVITDRGRPVARLSGIDAGHLLDRLADEGRLSRVRSARPAARGRRRVTARGGVAALVVEEREARQ